MGASEADKALKAMLDRLDPVTRRISASATKPATALDAAANKVHAFLTGLRNITGVRKYAKEAHSKLTSYFRFGAYAWEVDPTWFTAQADDRATSSSQMHGDEKDTVLAMLDVTEGLISYLLARCMEEKPLVEGEEVERLDEVGWKSPLEGWQGVLLAVLDGLQVHLTQWNPAQADGPLANTAYRERFARKLLPSLVKVAVPTKGGLPTAPGQPLKDDAESRKICVELKYAALDIVNEAQARLKKKTPQLLRDALPMDWLGAVLQSGSDSQMSAIAIDLAWRVLQRRVSPKNSNAEEVERLRREQLEQLFSLQRFGREATPCRQLFDKLSSDAAKWTEHSSKLLETINQSDIERGPCFVIKDANFHGIHLLPTQSDEQLEGDTLIEAAEVVKGDIFTRARIWFDRDCISFLADEPKELREERLHAQASISAVPDVDEDLSRDARFLVPFRFVEKIEVRKLLGVEGHHTISLDLSETIRVDGRPFPDEAIHAGPGTRALATATRPHRLNFVVVCGNTDLALLHSAIENRSKRYPQLGESLQFISDGDEEHKVENDRPVGHADLEPDSASKHPVKQAPRKSSQATPVETVFRPKQAADASKQRNHRDGQGEGASEDREPDDAEGDEAEPDLAERRSALATMARLDSPNGSSLTTRRRSHDAQLDGSPEARQDKSGNAYEGGLDDGEIQPPARHTQGAYKAAGERTTNRSESVGSDLYGDSDADERNQAPIHDKASENAKAKAKKVSRQSPNLEQADEQPTDGLEEASLETSKQRSASNRRSPRISPPPAQQQDEAQGRQGRKKVVQPPVRSGIAPPKKPPTASKTAAVTGRKKDVDAPRGRKRGFGDVSDLSDLSELSDLAGHESDDQAGHTSNDDTLPRRKGRNEKEAKQADSRRSKRRKRESPNVEADNLTDYDNEFPSLPEKHRQQPAQKQFGKSRNEARPTTGKTRKANAKSAPTARSEKPNSRVAAAARGAKLKSKEVENAPDKSEKKTAAKMLEKTTITRTTRSRARKQVVVEPAVETPEASSEEEEVGMANKKGDRRVSDDIPPPMDLTSSERTRAQQLAPRSPNKDSPSKPKPIRTLAQLTGDGTAEDSEQRVINAAGEDAESEGYGEMPFEFQEEPAGEDAAGGPGKSRDAGLAVSKPISIPIPPTPTSGAAQHSESAPRPVPESASNGDSKIGVIVEHLQQDRDRDAHAPLAGTRDKPREGRPVPSKPTAATAALSQRAPPLPRSTTPPDSPQDLGAVSQLFAPIRLGSRPSVAPVDDSGVDFDGTTSAIANAEAAALLRDKVATGASSALKGVAPGVPAAGRRAIQSTSAPARPSPLAAVSPIEAGDDMDLDEGPDLGKGPGTARLYAANAHQPNKYRQPSPPTQSTPAHGSRISGHAYEVPWAEVQGYSKTYLPVTTVGPGEPAAAVPAPTRNRLAGGPAALASTAHSLWRKEIAKGDAYYEQPSYQTRTPAGAYWPQLDVRPPDAYEEFFDGLISLSRALVNKQREQHEQLRDRRDAAVHKVDKLVEHHIQTNACVTHEVALDVSRQSRALRDSKATTSAQHCARDVLSRIAGVQADLQGLRKKLAEHA